MRFGFSKVISSETAGGVGGLQLEAVPIWACHPLFLHRHPSKRKWKGRQKRQIGNIFLKMTYFFLVKISKLFRKILILT